MLQREFSELQGELENVIIGLKISTDAREKRELLYRMSKLIVEADAALKEQPSNKSFQAGSSD